MAEERERKRFGARIREARDRKGWSQSELGRQSGVNRTLIVNVEAGRKTLSLSAARRVARALGVGLDYLAGTFEDDPRMAAVGV